MKLKVEYCSPCGKIVDRRGRYCRECHNAYMRKWRVANRPSEEEMAKGRTRGRTRYLIRKGVLTKGPCEVCATTQRVEAHHPDYNDAVNVIWLCLSHHRDLHRGMREATNR